MVKAFQSLLIINIYNTYNPKRPFAYEFKDFKPITNMVLHYYLIVSMLIIIPKIEFLSRTSLDLLTLQPKEINFLIVQDFSFFIVC